MPFKKKTDDDAKQVLTIPPIEVVVYQLSIVGDSPLICHAWSHKAQQEMLDKQTGAATAKKAPKDPEQDYESGFYRLPDGRPGFPTIAFKSAAVDAASQVNGLTKVFLRGSFHLVGDLVAIQGNPIMRSDMVRIGMGTADIRFRPEFVDWSVDLLVRMNARSLTVEQLVHLFNLAGFSVGVGEWRPEKNGRNGMFHVDSVARVKE